MTKDSQVRDDELAPHLFDGDCYLSMERMAMDFSSPQ